MSAVRVRRNERSLVPHGLLGVERHGHERGAVGVVGVAVDGYLGPAEEGVVVALGDEKIDLGVVDAGREGQAARGGETQRRDGDEGE